MKAIDRIKSFLISANDLFPDLKFRCGFGSTEHTYIVEVSPLAEFNNNEDYAKMERDFSISFQEEYRGDDVIFVAEDDLIEVRDIVFVIGKPQVCESYFAFDLENPSVDLFNLECGVLNSHVVIKETYSFDNNIPKDEFCTSSIYELAA